MLIRKLAFLPVILLFLLTGCDKDNTVPVNDQKPVEGKYSEDLNTAFAEFGFDLFKEASAKEESGKNVILSPLSVSTALAMVYQGSDGTTKEAMAEALKVKALSIDEINEGSKAALDYLHTADPKVEFNFANAIFWDPFKLTPYEEFLSANTAYYDATLEAISFSDPQTVNVINEWVKSKTKGKIEKIIEDISPDEAMLLLNALYLKGDWKQPFAEDLTSSGQFYLSPSNTVQAEFMYHQSFWPYVQNEEMQMVDLGLGDSLYSVYFILPNETTDIHSLVSDLSNEKINSLIDNLHETHLSLRIPKFELDYHIKLKDALTALGMGEAFDTDKANFSNLGSGAGNIYISRVEHKTNVTVDETGFEGAAVTAVGVGVTSVPSPLVFDRPFLFFLREAKTGSMIFMAKVMNPQED